jgi:integrase
MKKRRDRGQGGLIKKKGSDCWYAVWRQNGRQICRSTGTTVKQVAERKLQVWLGKAQSGRPLSPELSKVKYEALRDAYVVSSQTKGRKSLYTNKEGVTSFTSLKHIDAYFAGWQVGAIKPDHIHKFVRKRQAAGAANGTINRSLAALRAMFRLALKEEKIAAVPYIEMLKEADARQGFLTVGEFDRLFRALPEKLRPVLALGYYRGLRLGEIRNLRWGNVDLSAGVIRLTPGETKSGKGRVIPLNPAFTKMLKKLRQETNSTYVFGNGRPLGSFRKTWYSTCVKCGLGHYEELGDGSRVYIGTLFHDLRRSAIRNMMQGGIDPNEAMAISGHETASVFKRYNIITEDRLLAASEKADAFIEAQRQALASDTVVHAEVIHPALPEAKGE